MNGTHDRRTHREEMMKITIILQYFSTAISFFQIKIRKKEMLKSKELLVFISLFSNSFYFSSKNKKEL